MHTIKRLLVRVAPMIFCLLPSTFCLGQGTAFTYQGRLNVGSNPANGLYDLQFGVFDAATNGAQQGSYFTNSATVVSNGLFTVILDFGSGIFTGPARWLDISVRTNGGTFVPLTPRQVITSTPYAIQSLNAASAMSAQSVLAGNITGTLNPGQLPSGIVTNGASGVSISGAFTGNGSGLTNVPGTSPWQTVAGTNVMAASNQSYLVTNSSMTTVMLPVAANVGDIVTVSGSNNWQVVGGWTVNNNAPATNWSGVASSADGAKLVASSGAQFSPGRIYTSTDSGRHWSVTSNFFGVVANDSWTCVASSADGATLAAGSTDGQYLAVSSDSGAMWFSEMFNVIQYELGPPSQTSVACSAGGIVVAWTGAQYQLGTPNAGFQNGVSMANGSILLLSSSTNSPVDLIVWTSVACSSDGTKLVTLASNGQIFTSTNSGATWSTNNNFPGVNWTSVASSSDGTRLVAAGSASQIFTSTNSGVTWSTNNSPSANWTSVASSADGSKLVAASGTGIYISRDSGATWANSGAPAAAWASVASSADGTRLVAAVNGGRLWTSGYFPGTVGTSQFQYLGNGVWQPVATPASQITGTLPAADLPASVVTNGEAGVALSGTFGGNISGNGSGLTNLNAAQLTGGPVPNSVLPATLALLNANNSFTGIQTINGNLAINNSTIDLNTVQINQTNETADGYGLVVAANTLNAGVPYGECIQMSAPALAGGIGLVVDDSAAGDNSTILLLIRNNVNGTRTNIMAVTAGGNVGIGTNAPQAVLHVVGNILGTGSIKSPMSRVANIINTGGPLNLTNSFASGGGTLIISASGSGYSLVGGARIGMNVVLDGTTVDNCSVEANPANTHMAFVPKTIVKPGVSAGNHTLVLSPISGTSTDVNDNFNVTVQEVPY
jgi:hypothetical protein